MVPWFGQAFGTQAFSPSVGRGLMPFQSPSLLRRMRHRSVGRRGRPGSPGASYACRRGRCQRGEPVVKPVLQVGTKLVSGWREMADRLLGATRASFEKGIDHSRRLVEAGSIHEALKLQEQWVRAVSTTFSQKARKFRPCRRSFWGGSASLGCTVTPFLVFCVQIPGCDVDTSYGVFARAAGEFFGFLNPASLFPGYFLISSLCTKPAPRKGGSLGLYCRLFFVVPGSCKIRMAL